MSHKEFLRGQGLNEDDAQKMISDAVFFFLVADQKKSVIKVNKAGIYTIYIGIFPVLDFWSPPPLPLVLYPSHNLYPQRSVP